MQFNTPASTLKIKFGNSTPKKINQPVAFAVCSPSRPLVFVSFALSPAVRAVDRPPDGGYPRENTVKEINK
jgi:hypothetical protein